MAAMAGESIRVTRSVALPLSDIEFRTSRSSGPGGQHAQKTESRVEAVLDVVASRALTVLRAIAQDERSQIRNKELATDRLVGQLREALKVPRRRRPTKPSRAAVERQRETKKRRSQTKRLRRGPADE
jgi:ribosome-associated protein